MSCLGIVFRNGAKYRCAELVSTVLVHHVAVISMFSSALASNYALQLQVRQAGQSLHCPIPTLQYVQILFLINEASTPFVNLNFLMRLHACDPFWAVAVNGIAMW